MTNAQAIAESQVCARHVYKQLDRLMRFELNPNKVKCGVKSLAGFLHRTCCSFTFQESDKAIEECMTPLFDAKGCLQEALLCTRLNRDLVKLAMIKLKRIADQINTN